MSVSHATGALLDVADARCLARDLLAAAGAVVAKHLVDSSVAGVHSHGLLRLSRIRGPRLGGSDRSEGGADCRGGAVPSCASMGSTGSDRWPPRSPLISPSKSPARPAYRIVTVRRTSHAGRIGAYTEVVARKGLVSPAFCSSPRSGHFVAPFGGRSARLATNPLSYGLPTSSDPIVADFSTSAMPEGAIRSYRNRGAPRPLGILRDARGQPTTDLNALYEEPPAVIKPFGGVDFGYKGWAHGLLVELMATVLAGDDTTDASRRGNNLALVAIAPPDGTLRKVDRLVEYIRSTLPVDPSQPVLLPGDRERMAAADAIRVAADGPTWDTLAGLAQELGVTMPQAHA